MSYYSSVSKSTNRSRRSGSVLRVGGRFGSIHSFQVNDNDYDEDGEERSAFGYTIDNESLYSRRAREGVCESISSANSSMERRRRRRRESSYSSTTNEESLLIDKDKRESVTTTTLPAPTVFVWGVPGIMCALSYALYNVFIKLGSYSISPVLGGVILQLVACFLGVLLLFFTQSTGEGKGVLREIRSADREGVIWACAAGASVGIAEMLSFFVSSLGVQASQSIPVIIGGSVLFDVILGVVFLKENLGMKAMIGVPLVFGGIAAVASSVSGTGGTTIGAFLGFHETNDVLNAGTELDLIDWIFPAIVCAFAYALYNVFIKKASDTMNPLLGGVILQIVAMLLGTALLTILLLSGEITLQYDKKGVFWACLAGLSVGTAEMLSFYVSSLGVPVSVSTATVVGGSVVLGSSIGWIVLGDALTFGSGFGVLFVLLGVISVAFDAIEYEDEEDDEDDNETINNNNNISDDEDGNITPPKKISSDAATVGNVTFNDTNVFVKAGGSAGKGNTLSFSDLPRYKFAPALEMTPEENSVHRPKSPMLARFLNNDEETYHDMNNSESAEDFFFGKPFDGLSSDGGSRRLRGNERDDDEVEDFSEDGGSSRRSASPKH